MNYKPDSVRILLEPVDTGEHKISRILMSVWLAVQAAQLLQQGIAAESIFGVLLMPLAAFALFVSESLWQPRPLAFYGGMLVGGVLIALGAHNLVMYGGWTELIVGLAVAGYIWMIREILLDPLN